MLSHSSLPAGSHHSPEDIVLRLPHPYHTPYVLRTQWDKVTNRPIFSAVELPPQSCSRTREETLIPRPLHNTHLFFSEITNLDHRASGAPRCTLFWDGEPGGGAGGAGGAGGGGSDVAHPRPVPTEEQIWLLVYIIFTIQPAMQVLRVRLQGEHSTLVADSLKRCGLAIDVVATATCNGGDGSGSGASSNRSSSSSSSSMFIRHASDEALLLRSTLWQGSASPFGRRQPIWLTYSSATPPIPLHYIITHPADSAPPIRHPLRPPKPPPNTVVYSRWIPHLRQTLSLLVLDDVNDSDPGQTLFYPHSAESRSYQQQQQRQRQRQRQRPQSLMPNPSRMSVVAKLDDGTPFASAEVYWAREDPATPTHNCRTRDFDRGVRHVVIGHDRVSDKERRLAAASAWSCLLHYAFLDDVRTMAVLWEVEEEENGENDDTQGGIPFVASFDEGDGLLKRCWRDSFFEGCGIGENGLLGGSG